MKKLLTTIVSLMFFGSLVFTQLAEFSNGIRSSETMGGGRRRVKDCPVGWLVV